MEPSELSLLFQITSSRETRSQLKIAGSFGFTLFMSYRINFAHYNTKFSTQRLSCLPKCVCVVCALSRVCVCVRQGDIELLLSHLFIFWGVCAIVLCATASVWSSEDSLQGSVLSFHHEGSWDSNSLPQAWQQEPLHNWAISPDLCCCFEQVIWVQSEHSQECTQFWTWRYIFLIWGCIFFSNKSLFLPGRWHRSVISALGGWSSRSKRGRPA